MMMVNGDMVVWFLLSLIFLETIRALGYIFLLRVRSDDVDYELQCNSPVFAAKNNVNELTATRKTQMAVSEKPIALALCI
jgi:hypothetical protein